MDPTEARKALAARLAKARQTLASMEALGVKIEAHQVPDPACGCGNVSYEIVGLHHAVLTDDAAERVARYEDALNGGGLASAPLGHGGQRRRREDRSIPIPVPWSRTPLRLTGQTARDAMRAAVLMLMLWQVAEVSGCGWTAQALRAAAIFARDAGTTQ
jgi:hypothetical protein